MNALMPSKPRGQKLRRIHATSQQALDFSFKQATLNLIRHERCLHNIM
jgi:hypothetical protein